MFKQKYQLIFLSMLLRIHANIFFNLICLLFEPHLVVLRAYFWIYALGLLLAQLREPYQVLRIEHELGTCKVIPLPIVLSLHSSVIKFDFISKYSIYLGAWGPSATFIHGQLTFFCLCTKGSFLVVQAIEKVSYMIPPLSD